jgi:hypothetical protein
VKPLDFFSAHPVFTREEFARALAERRKASSQTVASHLGRYLRAGRIGRVKRGVFFAAGPGETAAKSPVDFLLVRLNEVCTAATERLLAWSEREREFIDRLSDRGEIVAELISDEPVLQVLVREQPLLQWKALNVRKFRSRG